MLVPHPLNQDKAVLLFHIAGAGGVNNLVGSLIDEFNRDVIHFFDGFIIPNLEPLW